MQKKLTEKKFIFCALDKVIVSKLFIFEEVTKKIPSDEKA